MNFLNDVDVDVDVGFFEFLLFIVVEAKDQRN